jgi:hypothetical protein
VSQHALRAFAAAIVAVPLMLYPVVSVGGARFPSRDDCARLPSGAPGEPLDVVYGRLGDPVAAADLRDALARGGFVGAEIAFDACGRWVVLYDPIDSLEQGQALAEQVRKSGFEARVEAAP